MSEFKTLTFKEISDALNAGKQVEVETSSFNPYSIKEGQIVDNDESFSFVSESILKAMNGKLKARILEPKLTRWIVVYWCCGKQETNTLTTEESKERIEERCKKEGSWVRTVKVEV